MASPSVYRGPGGAGDGAGGQIQHGSGCESSYVERLIPRHTQPPPTPEPIPPSDLHHMVTCRPLLALLPPRSETASHGSDGNRSRETGPALRTPLGSGRCLVRDPQRRGRHDRRPERVREVDPPARPFYRHPSRCRPCLGRRLRRRPAARRHPPEIGTPFPPLVFVRIALSP